MKQMKLDQVKQLFRQMKPFMEERLIWFVYHKKTHRHVCQYSRLKPMVQVPERKFGILQKLKFCGLSKQRRIKIHGPGIWHHS
jgi:hypothetical protein